MRKIIDTTTRSTVPRDLPCEENDCPKTLDVGRAKLTVGLAWHYKKYRMEQSEEDRLVYGFDEQEAELDDFHAVSGIPRGRSGGVYTDPRIFGFRVGRRLQSRGGPFLRVEPPGTSDLNAGQAT